MESFIWVFCKRIFGNSPRKYCTRLNIFVINYSYLAFQKFLKDSVSATLSVARTICFVWFFPYRFVYQIVRGFKFKAKTYVSMIFFCFFLFKTKCHKNERCALNICMHNVYILQISVQTSFLWCAFFFFFFTSSCSSSFYYYFDTLYFNIIKTKTTEKKTKKTLVYILKRGEKKRIKRRFKFINYTKEQTNNTHTHPMCLEAYNKKKKLKKRKRKKIR